MARTFACTSRLAANVCNCFALKFKFKLQINMYTCSDTRESIYALLLNVKRFQQRHCTAATQTNSSLRREKRAIVRRKQSEQECKSVTDWFRHGHQAEGERGGGKRLRHAQDQTIQVETFIRLSVPTITIYMLLLCVF